MGVRSHASAAPRRLRSVGPGLGPSLVVVVAALVLLVANGRAVGSTDVSGAASWLLRGAVAAAGSLVRVDAGSDALVGKALASAFAALAAGFLFSAVGRRRGSAEGRWAGLVLALGTTLAAAAQAWSGEAAATCAVALALLLLVRSEEEDEPGPAVRAGLPLGLAAALQPSAAALAAVLAGAVLVRWRRAGLPVLAWAAPGAVLVLLPGPSVAHPPDPGPLALIASPAKGALVFAPIVLVALAGLAKALRAPAGRLWDQPQPGRLLPVASGLAATAHLAAVAVVGGWSAGDFWGPRWVAPAWPPLMLFLPEGFALLRTAGTLLAVLSVGVQALGAASYDGRWDRLFRGPAGELTRTAWEVGTSPILFQARERTVRVALPALEGGRLVTRARVLAPSGAAGSFVSFARTPPGPDGVERTMTGLRLEGGARVEDGRLRLLAPGDGVAFRVPEVARARRLELRVVGRGSATLSLGESDPGTEPRWRDRPVSGSFRLKLPYHHPDSGGAILTLELRAGGPIAIDSIALVPPNEPESVLRLP